MGRIKAISLDLTGTISTEDFSNSVWLEGIPELYARRNGLDLERAKEIVFSQYKEIGEERSEWYDIKYWFGRLGLGDGWRDLLNSYRDRVRIFEDAREAIPLLGERYRLILLSNAGREFIEMELGEGGLLHFFDTIISATQDMGEVKKTPSFYRKVLKSLGLEPHELLHAGDHILFDYRAPRRVGIRAYLVDREGKRRARFRIKSLKELISLAGDDP